MSNILFLKGRMEWWKRDCWKDGRMEGKRLEVWKGERGMEGQVLDVLGGILEFV